MRDRTSALLNVVVFAPLAFYAWRGQKAPELLVLTAALVGIGAFLRDVRILLSPAEPPEQPPPPGEELPAAELLEGLGLADRRPRPRRRRAPVVPLRVVK